MRWHPFASWMFCLGAACVHSHPDWGVGGFIRLANGAPVAGVAVVIEWVDEPTWHLTLTTNADGYYQHDWDSALAIPDSVLDHVRVTPERDGYTFSPAAYEMHLPARRHDLHFTATRTGAADIAELRGLCWTIENGRAVDVQTIVGWLRTPHVDETAAAR